MLYDVTKVIVSLNDAIATGFAPDSKVSVEQDGENTKTVGLDGRVTFNLNPDKSGTVTLTLLNNSETNTLLTKYYNGNVLFSVSIDDLNIEGDASVFASKCLISKPAARVYNGEATNFEWTILCDKIVSKYDL